MITRLQVYNDAAHNRNREFEIQHLAVLRLILSA